MDVAIGDPKGGHAAAISEPTGGRAQATTFGDVARAAVDADRIASAAIFVTAPRAGAGAGAAPDPGFEPQPEPELRLAAAAGISGPPLDGLVAAVRDPRHPIRRSLADAGPTWDVAPMSPGGPALRSHLPLRLAAAPGDAPAVGVLALAHDARLSSDARQRLEGLADQAAAVVASTRPQEETR